ncbi:hypothetical protein [Mycobacterium sp. DBP42]|uniref:hypothetical protein n=1 Tax=Mycobacteriaceae TaxID=1762 RepID=UPI00110CBA3A|nr:hypothetical protein [Mycobacterium sp. DBP42]TMS50715.1 hypothetical protein E0T84_22795 [Mycobacterium sp. DBP42]
MTYIPTEQFWLPLPQPPHNPEANGIEDAITAYSSIDFAVAKDPWGQVMSWHPASSPHQLITGASSGGTQSATTATIQTLAAQCARAHWAVHIAASHDDNGYRELQEWPNVRCITTRPSEQITLITHLHDLLQQRLCTTTGGHSDAPVVLFVDTWHHVLAEIRSSGYHRPIVDALAALLRLGRAVRIHVVMAGAARERHAASGWISDIVYLANELRLYRSPYLDGFLPIYRRLGWLRPTQSSYPPFDPSETPTTTNDDTGNHRAIASTTPTAKTSPPVGLTRPRAWRFPTLQADKPSDIEVGRYAVRTFTVDRHRGALAPVSIAPHLDNIGVNGHLAWEAGVCEARCVHGYDHTAPDEDCSCGIYGATTLTSLRRQFPDLAAGIVAIIAAEGPTLIGNAGLRTSAARVVSYWCHPGPAFDEARTVLSQQCSHAQEFDDLGAMLAAYDIPVTDYDTSLIANMHYRISLGPIDPDHQFWSPEDPLDTDR